MRVYLKRFAKSLGHLNFKYPHNCLNVSKDNKRECAKICVCAIRVSSQLIANSSEDDGGGGVCPCKLQDSVISKSNNIQK